MPIILPQQDSDAYSSFHLFIIRVQIKNVHQSHKQIFKSLRKKGINVNLHYIPIYLHPYHKNRYNMKEFSNANNYYNSAISIPMYPSIKNREIKQVISCLKKAII